MRAIEARRLRKGDEVIVKATPTLKSAIAKLTRNPYRIPSYSKVVIVDVIVDTKCYTYTATLTHRMIQKKETHGRQG